MLFPSNSSYPEVGFPLEFWFPWQCCSLETPLTLKLVFPWNSGSLGISLATPLTPKLVFPRNSGSIGRAVPLKFLLPQSWFSLGILVPLAMLFR